MLSFWKWKETLKGREMLHNGYSVIGASCNDKNLLGNICIAAAIFSQDDEPGLVLAAHPMLPSHHFLCLPVLSSLVTPNGLWRF